MNIAIFGNSYQDNHLASLEALLRSAGDSRFFVHYHFYDYLLKHGLKIGERVKDIPEDAERVWSFGGDGTFLRAAAWVGPRMLPIFGINTGHLGYLTGFSFDSPSLSAVYEQYGWNMSMRMMLEVKGDFSEESFNPFALNEVAVSKGDTTSMLCIRAGVNGAFLAEYMADGLIVATPTGSTAYNLSVGGPILQPILSAFAISPIAPHSLTMRPLVVSGDSEIELEISSRGGEECHVSLDGRVSTLPSSGSRLLIRRAPHQILVAQPEGSTFSQRLREKLNWGI